MSRLSYVFISFGLTLLLLQSCTTVQVGRKTVYSSEGKREHNTRPSTGKNSKKVTTEYRSSTSVVSSGSEVQTRDEIVLTALKYAGMEYRTGGKNPETGFDCSGFTSFVYERIGIPLASSSSLQSQQGRKKSINNLEPGDLVFFGQGKSISHVAIVTGRNVDDLEVIHSTTSGGVKVDNITRSEYWNSRTLFGVDVISR
ncbi:MAG: C40 family peptidase [Saprospiraceae bacterium]